MLKAIPQDNSIEDGFHLFKISFACAACYFLGCIFHSDHVPMPVAYQLVFRELTVEVRLH